MNLPKRKAKRETQRPITAWVETSDLNLLAKHEINLSELVRQAIHDAAVQLRKKP